MFKRIYLIVADSLGCGFSNNDKLDEDYNTNTLKRLVDYKPDIVIPNLKKMGLLNLIEDKQTKTNCVYTKSEIMSNGKDTLTGHHEMVGIYTKKPAKTFTDTGFPKELIDEIIEKTGYNVIGNISASGTQIISDLGMEHILTKSLIIYTSSDSVLQIACHEKYFGLEELYRVCKIVREICYKEEYLVARIIARPFIGENKSDFKRTSNRVDYALSPIKRTTLDELFDNKYMVYAIGKINDIFNHCGITMYKKTSSNHDGMSVITTLSKTMFDKGLYFLNLVDFDSLYGHRRDICGYVKCLEEFDKDLEEFIPNLGDDDLLIITADHGNDPGHVGTDHTKEFVPVLIFNKNLEPKQIKTLKTVADIGQTIADNFNVEEQEIGQSLLKILEKRKN